MNSIYSPSPLSSSQPVGVIGAGAMGRGIAQVAAAAGHEVRLFDAAPAAAAQAVDMFRADLDKLVGRNKISAEEAEKRIGRLLPVDSLDLFAGVALVIEAVVEIIQVKRDIFAQLESIVSDDVILATNTSSLSVTEISKHLIHPERFAGMHFFNPAPILPLVEIVKGAATHADVAQCLVQTAKNWKKIPVVCGSTPGFIVNRIARPFYGEAMRLLGEGAASVATIDTLLKESGGFRMGPFELTDLIGQDVNFSVTQSVCQGFFGDPRYQPSLVQQELVFAGHLGRKTGKGFYCYEDGMPAAHAQIAASAARPESVIFFGTLGPAENLVEMAKTAGIEVVRSEGDGFIQIDELKIFLTDGRLATERSVAEGPIALFDLALDFERTKLIALAFADSLSDSSRQKAIGFFQALDIQVSVIDDVAGMVVMRTVAMLINEAIDAVYLSVASPEDIETAMLRGVNYPIGLLDWCEKLGSKRVLEVLENLAVASPDGRYRASPLLRRKAALEILQSREIRRPYE